MECCISIEDKVISAENFNAWQGNNKNYKKKVTKHLSKSHKFVFT